MYGPKYFFRFNVVKVHPKIKEWKEISKVKKALTIARHCYGKGAVYLTYVESRANELCRVPRRPARRKWFFFGISFGQRFLKKTANELT